MTDETDREAIFRVEAEAFGYDKEAKLVESLLDDSTAEPRVSLLAVDDDRAVGHILFTAAGIGGRGVRASLLAPLAVVPDSQGMGVGGRLVKAGLKHLAAMGVELVFVLGHPTYYPRFGFVPAHTHGLEAPYPIPGEHADAWMVRSLNGTVPGDVRGTVACAHALRRPEHWRE